MSPLVECPRESEVVTAVAGGQWPDAVDASLRDHVATCAVCTEAREMAVAMTALEAETLADVRLPSAGQVWWRAQMRARREAAQAAARPVLLAQALGAACAVGLVAGLVSWQWPALAEAAGHWVGQPLASVDLGLAAWGGLAMAAVLGPLAIYAAVRE